MPIPVIFHFFTILALLSLAFCTVYTQFQHFLSYPILTLFQFLFLLSCSLIHSLFNQHTPFDRPPLCEDIPVTISIFGHSHPLFPAILLIFLVFSHSSFFTISCPFSIFVFASLFVALWPTQITYSHNSLCFASQVISVQIPQILACT
jgi:hypothetical protein